METVAPAVSPDQPDHFAEIAAELRRAADDIETLVGSGLPKPNHVALDIHPGGPRLDRDDDRTARAVDALGLALLGKPGTANKMYDDTYHYGTESTQRGPIKVHVYDSVSTAWAVKRETADSLAAKEAELERLRAEVTALRAAAALQPDADPAGLGFSRDDIEPEHVEAAPGVDATPVGHAAGRVVAPPVAEDLRETVHWRTGKLTDPGIACGAVSGPFTKDPAKVTCPACLDEVPFPESENDGEAVSDIPDGRVGKPVALIRCGCGPTHTEDCPVVPASAE